jgi:hypothetical protein
VLKKAGIVVAAAAAGLLAVSPLAFAGDKGDDNGHRHHGGESNVIAGDHSEGLINASSNNIAVPINVCDNQVPVNVLGVQVPVNDVEVLADLSGALGLGLLGDAKGENEDSGSTTLDDSCHNEVAGDVSAIED